MTYKSLAKALANARRTKTERGLLYYLHHRTGGRGKLDFTLEEVADKLHCGTDQLKLALKCLDIKGLNYYGKPKKGLIHRIEFVVRTAKQKKLSKAK